MDNIIIFFFDYIKKIFNLLSSVNLKIGGVSVSWTSLLLGGLFLCIIVSVFWRGARK